MKVAFESDLLIPYVSKTISILTDGAKVCIDDVHYDNVRGIVDLYVQRKELTGFKKSFLGEFQPVYSQTMINSLLTIKQVKEMDIRFNDRLAANRLAANCGSCFTLLFGLKLDGTQVYLGSAEEIQGKSLCEIFIKVQGISIELGDE